MPPFRDWLARVLAAGESVQSAPPVLAPAERSGVAADLGAAFDRHALAVAGPSVEFDAATGVSAAVALARACWRLAAGDADASPLWDGPEPPTAGAHLSADVTLRLLPGVLRRTRARGEGVKPLADAVEALLRAWPLSGVLADLDGAPTAPPEFAGHTGLQLLYAERLVLAPRAGWVPAAGPGRAWVERAFAERGTPLPTGG